MQNTTQFFATVVKQMRTQNCQHKSFSTSPKSLFSWIKKLLNIVHLWSVFCNIKKISNFYQRPDYYPLVMTCFVLQSSKANHFE